MQADIESKVATQTDPELPADHLFPSNDPIQVRNVALLIISTLAVVFAMDWAQSFIVTVLLGGLLAYALNPLVIRLESVKVHRVIGSSLIIIALMAGIIFSGYALRGQVQSIISILPEAAIKLTSGIAVKRGDPLTNMQKVQIAANQVETAASSVENNIKTKKKPVMRVVLDEPKFKIVIFFGAVL